MNNPKDLESFRIEAAEKSPVELKPEFLTRLLFMSYRFSQGESGLQGKILLYLSQNHPEWRMAAGARAEFRKILPTKIEAFLASPAYHAPRATNKAGLDRDIDLHINVFYAGLDSGKQSVNSRLIPDIAEIMLKRDRYYLASTRDGRPGNSRSADAKHSMGDKYLSYVCHYALSGRSTGMAEYDDMFRAIKEYLLKVPDDGKRDSDNDTTLSYLTEIIQRHNEHHPGQEIDLQRMRQAAAAKQ